MSTFTQIYYHIVFSTKDREPVLLADKREPFFRYTWGILKNKDCHLYRFAMSFREFYSRLFTLLAFSEPLPGLRHCV